MNNRQSVQEYYSKLCSAIYRDIQDSATPRSAIPNSAIQDEKPIWTKEENSEYGITTWTHSHPDGKGTFRPPYGSNGQIVVKVFGPNSYDYIKTEDFIDRAELL